MKKTLSLSIALVSASLFTAAASANGFGQDVAGDILYGNGAVAASPASPYSQRSSVPNGTETDLLWNLQKIEQSSAFQPYELISGERDNRDDLRDQVS